MTDECGKWQCNQKCVFCYAAGQEMGKTKEMSTQQWKQAIDRLDAARVPMVTFTGGEPTQRADIAELVGYAKRMVTRLNTNGVNLTPELVRQLKAAGLYSVQVTLYSHDEAIHNTLVGSNHHADTVQGMDPLRRVHFYAKANLRGAEREMRLQASQQANLDLAQMLIQLQQRPELVTLLNGRLNAKVST